MLYTISHSQMRWLYASAKFGIDAYYSVNQFILNVSPDLSREGGSIQFWKLFRNVSASMSWFDSSTCHIFNQVIWELSRLEYNNVVCIFARIYSITQLVLQGRYSLSMLPFDLFPCEWYCTDNAIVLNQVRSDLVLVKIKIIKHYFTTGIIQVSNGYYIPVLFQAQKKTILFCILTCC